MNREEIYNTIKDFYDLIDAGKATTDENERTLIILLDRLALASGYIEFTFDEKEYDDPPAINLSDLRKIIAKRFPNFGSYISETLLGDAIDDIQDIFIELRYVLWYWNNSADNALWHYRVGYDTHWKQHLRDLQLYLFARSRESMES